MSSESQDHAAAEKRALRLSPIGYLVFGILGLVFFLLTRSEAILLDAVYSLISITLAMVAMQVSNLVEQPDTDRFNFGFGHFEPLLNVVRVTLIMGVCAFALFSAIESLWSGGRALNSGRVVVYGAFSAASCVTMGFLQWRASKKIDSALLRVDARNWIIDGVISTGIGVAFLFAYLIEGTKLESWAPYVDPVLVIVLIVGCLPIVFQSVKENLPQLLLHSPEASRQAQVRSIVSKEVAEMEPEEVSVRMIEMGRFFYVMVHVVVSDASKMIAVGLCDRARDRVREQLQGMYKRPVVDVILTADGSEVLGRGAPESLIQ